jgi:hypothetical protein
VLSCVPRVKFLGLFLEKPRHRWENGFKVDLRKVGWKDLEWIHLV